MSTKEITRLGKFIQSPYFNNSELILHLFNAIKRQHPRYAGKSIEKEKLFQKLFPNEGFNYKKITDLYSDLVKLIEKFLTIEMLDQNEPVVNGLRLKVYEERHLERSFRKQFDQAQKHFKEKVNKTAFDYGDMTAVAFDYYFHPTTERLSEKEKSVQSAMGYLDRYFILMKMRLGMELYSRQEIIPEKNEIWQLNEVLKNTELLKNENKLFVLYPKIIQFLKGSYSEKEFETLNRFIQTNKSDVPLSELRPIMIAMANKAWQIYTQGKKKYINYLFEIYKTGLKYNGVFFQNGKIRETTFNNIVVTACIIKEFHWAKLFIKKNQSYLIPNEKDRTVLYSNAIISFHEKKFEKTLLLLNKEQKTKGILELRNRFLRTRTIFEIFFQDHSYETTVHSELLSFTKYVKKIKYLTEEKKALYLETTVWMRKLKNQKFKKINKQKKEEWKKKINESRLLAKEWLLEKIDQL
ncbi:MAG: hypothetical protein AAFZ15_06575 [Bacteroidota bacterium]